MHGASAFVGWAALACACACWSAVRSAPLTCEDLTRPLDAMDAGRFAGRRALVSGAFVDPAKLSYYKRRDSASVDVRVGPGGDVSYTARVHMEGKCHASSHNVTLEGGTLRFRDDVNVTVTFLYTSCADCILMRFDKDDETVMRAYLFSRRREVSREEREEFATQAACLNMTPPAWLDPSEELCPDENGGDV